MLLHTEVTLEQASGPSELEPFAEAIDHQQPSNGNVDRLQKESQHVPASYMDVLAILERGETPPGIRTDINDKPPNPEQPPPPARLKARPKPWEKKVSDESIMMRSQDQQQEAQVLDTLVTEEQHQESEFVIAKPSQSIFEAATSPSRPSPSVILERLASPTRVINNSQTDGSSTTPNRITRRPLPIDINFDSESKSVEKGGEKSSTSIGSTQGSGLGRPSSRGWKPPPIPMPTLPLPVSEKTSLKSNEVDEEALSLE